MSLSLRLAIEIGKSLSLRMRDVSVEDLFGIIGSSASVLSIRKDRNMSSTLIQITVVVLLRGVRSPNLLLEVHLISLVETTSEYLCISISFLLYLNIVETVLGT